MAMVGPEQRASATGPLVRAWLGGELDDHERQGIEALMTILLDDPDRRVRLALAEVLADAPAAPHAVVLGLAQDEEEIAALVVGRSPVLIDAELVDIAALAGEAVQVAAAGRRPVSPALAAALAEVAVVPALIALIENRQAAIPHFSLDRIVERAGHERGVRQAMLARAGVPIAIRQTLLDQLATSLKTMVLERDWMSEERIDALTREAKDKATIALAASAEPQEIGILVAHLRARGQLTTALLLRAACNGNIRLLGEALANLAGMPAARVSALMAEGGEGPFRALARKAGLPERSHPAFWAAIEVNRDLHADVAAGALDDAAFTRLVTERVLARCPGDADGEFRDLVVMLRRLAAEAARDAARQFIARSLETAADEGVAEPANDDMAAEDWNWQGNAWETVAAPAWEDPDFDTAFAEAVRHAVSGHADGPIEPEAVERALADYVFPEEAEPAGEEGSPTEGWAATQSEADLPAEIYYARGIRAA
ncbi:DUF2336 domain-containing protein [Prosthecodimorpha staleyi]|uniref:DUF2336 domain-containing protein n=1 Tax=Prosthecodimorpha staleyi TaxID=2840188 RepID=A0A947D584_9HYPH|nr:DUF2336 domain-containing protein [Prosthecodimorpha staleyi]MBT9290424.1 DUF2336 domain-containing protein [Prosthecodimorpha staleyi]